MVGELAPKSYPPGLQTYAMVHMCPTPPYPRCYKHTHNNDNFLLSQEIPDLGEGEHCMRWPLWFRI